MKRPIITLNVGKLEVPIGSHEGKTIVIGSDIDGLEYKNAVKKALNQDYSFLDFGVFYPNGVSNRHLKDYSYETIADKIGREVNMNPYTTVGIGICYEGDGIIKPVLKYPDVYVAKCLTSEGVKHLRAVENSNVIGFGVRNMSLEETIEAVRTWLTTPFYNNPEKNQENLEMFLKIMQLQRNYFTLIR